MSNRISTWCCSSISEYRWIGLKMTASTRCHLIWNNGYISCRWWFSYWRIMMDDSTFYNNKYTREIHNRYCGKKKKIEKECSFFLLLFAWVLVGRCIFYFSTFDVVSFSSYSFAFGCLVLFFHHYHLTYSFFSLSLSLVTTYAK